MGIQRRPNEIVVLLDTAPPDARSSLMPDSWNVYLCSLLIASGAVVDGSYVASPAAALALREGHSSRALVLSRQLQQYTPAVTDLKQSLLREMAMRDDLVMLRA